jgi:hypothetical protein
LTPARRTRLHPLAVLAALATLIACMMCTASAWAASESYGELARFGHAGAKEGDFKLNEFSAAFGVDAGEGNSVYVGDEPKKGEYRVQKLTSSGSFVAAATFLAECAAGKGGKCIEGTGEQGIQGITFDTVTNSKGEAERRLYVLAGFERSEKAAIDSEVVAAGGLYAFSTKASGKTLADAVGTGAEGVLATPSTLDATSETQGQALLEPKGIAVDPTTHEIIVAGRVDKGAVTGSSGGSHLALQRITDEGKLGARYVDPERGSSMYIEADSPVVTQDGQVLMQRANQIIQIPTSFSSTSAPKVVFQGEEGGIVEFGEEGEEHGDDLALAPGVEGNGTLYALAEITPATTTGNEGVLALSYTTKAGEEEVHVSELGWVSGASASGSHHCAIGFEGEFEPPMVAVGAEKKVFVLEPGFNSGSPEPQVAEFGPGGSVTGCPAAEASEPQASIEKVKVTKVHAGKEVTLSSTVTGANALSVEWNFGDGSTQTVSTDEHEEISVTHAFTKTGELTITETIHDDDLATPELTRTTKIDVEEASGASPKVATSPASVKLVEGEEASFTATATGTPTPTVQWEVSIDAGASWTLIAGATSASYKISSVRAAESGYEYRAAFSNVNGNSNSAAATMTVESTAEHEAKLAAQKQLETEHRQQLEREAQAAKERQEAKEAQERKEKEGTIGVLPIVEVAPTATIAASSLQVSASGAVSLKISCPIKASCAGTVTLRTLTAVASDRAMTAKQKKAILTLATGSFSVTGGSVKVLTLHLSAKARALLGHSHVLRARATILAHNASGATYTGQAIVSLHAAAKHKPKH